MLILVHGGAGPWSEERLPRGQEGVRRAAEAGFEVLKGGGSALDAVVEAVKVMEDDPTFNAGLGAAISWDGTVELDAAVMRGDTMEAGAVSGLRVRHAVEVARAVMEQTDCVFLAGEGARRFAERLGFREECLITEERLQAYRKYKKLLEEGKHPYLKKNAPWLLGDTVGAVALDDNGLLAAATSTGGLTLKMPGRVGDTPIIGGGTYADRAAAVSATGIGEAIMRVVLAKTVADWVRQGLHPKEAAEKGISYLEEVTGLDAGVIVVDREGRAGWATNAKAMPVAVLEG